MTTIALRPYQQETVDSVIAEHAKGINRQLISLPTAAGKTVIMANIIKYLNKRILVIAHRDELIEQFIRTAKLFVPRNKIGICKGKNNQLSKKIVIGSVQTCSNQKRLAELKKMGFDVLMIDEAHHAPAKSYQAIIETLGFKDTSGKLLIGVTATPQRSDHLRLDTTFEKIVYSKSIASLIQEGWLSPVVGRKIRTDITIKDVNTHMGDYAVGQLATAVNIPKRNALIVEKYLLHAAGRKAVAFCVNVAHSQDLAAAFNDKGIAAAAVWGSMAMDDRKKVLRDLKKGRLLVVTSCGILTEGFDEPSITTVIMARPTKSKRLYIQCVGRGLRLYPGKANCMVLDFTDSGHTLRSSMTFETALPELRPARQPIIEARRERVPTRTHATDVTEVSDTELDLLMQHSNFVWVPLKYDEYSLTDDDGNEFIIEPAGDRFIATLYIKGKRVEIITRPTTFDSCVLGCEIVAREQLKMAYAQRSGRWLSPGIEN